MQAAINAARSQLPSGMPNNPTYRKVNPADAPIMVLTLTSDTLTQGQMYDAAATVVAQKLSQVRGVGQVTVSGSSLPAVRVELNPTALNAYGIGLTDVRNALAAANANRPKGLVESGERQWWIYANDQARTAAEYRPLDRRLAERRPGAARRRRRRGGLGAGRAQLRVAGRPAGGAAPDLQGTERQHPRDRAKRVRDLMPWLQRVAAGCGRPRGGARAHLHDPRLAHRGPEDACDRRLPGDPGRVPVPAPGARRRSFRPWRCRCRSSRLSASCISPATA